MNVCLPQLVRQLLLAQFGPFGWCNFYAHVCYELGVYEEDYRPFSKAKNFHVGLTVFSWDNQKAHNLAREVLRGAMLDQVVVPASINLLGYSDPHQVVRKRVFRDLMVVRRSDGVVHFADAFDCIELLSQIGLQPAEFIAPLVCDGN